MYNLFCVFTFLYLISEPHSYLHVNNLFLYFVLPYLYISVTQITKFAAIKASFGEVNGRPVLMVNKHRFMRHYTSRRGHTRWRCCKAFNKCLAIVITTGNHIIKIKNIHNHNEPANTPPHPRMVQDTEVPFGTVTSCSSPNSLQPVPILELFPISSALPFGFGDIH